MFSTYMLLKLLHVVSAILWVGGISTLTVLYTQLTRGKEPAAIRALLRASTFTGRVIVGPAAGLTLIAGIATAVTGGFDFGVLWLTWGFMGIIASVVLGATLIRWTTNQITKVAAATPDEGATATLPTLGALQQRLTLLNILNLLILLSTVGAMVLKPM